MELFSWLPHLFCRCSIFSSEIQHGKTLTCFIPQTVLLLNLSFQLVKALLSCSFRSAFCFLFRLKLTTKSYQLFIYKVSWICSFLSSPILTLKGLALVTSLQLSQILLSLHNSKSHIEEPMTAPLCPSYWVHWLSPKFQAAVLNTSQQKPSIPILPSAVFPCPKYKFTHVIFTFTHATPLLRVVLSFICSTFILLRPICGLLLPLSNHFLFSIPLVLVIHWISHSSTCLKTPLEFFT